MVFAGTQLKSPKPITDVSVQAGFAATYPRSAE
jgi:hypothetical protein